MNTIQRKWTTLCSLLANPDRMRMFLKGKFPCLADDSIAVQLWYPAFWRLLSYNLRHRLGMKSELPRSNASNRYVTRIPSWGAGIGDQASSCWVETYSIARKLQLSFVHQPFARNIRSGNVDWEAFLGFGIGEIKICDLALGEGPQAIKTVFVPPFRHDCEQGLRAFEKIITKVYSGNNILFHLGSGVYLNNESEREFSPYEILRCKYFRANARIALNDVIGRGDEIRIAVHVRRGDLKDLKIANPTGYNRRWLDIAYYKRIIRTILAELGDTAFSIHVFSDGTPDDVRPLTAEFACVPHLEESAELAFHQMVSADILVPAMSSFSLVAGKLSRGIKVVGRHFDHVKPSVLIPQTGDWIRLEENGDISFKGRCQLERCIRERCQRNRAFLAENENKDLIMVTR
jgi:hypothetical protein